MRIIRHCKACENANKPSLRALQMQRAAIHNLKSCGIYHFYETPLKFIPFLKWQSLTINKVWIATLRAAALARNDEIPRILK